MRKGPRRPGGLIKGKLAARLHAAAEYVVGCKTAVEDPQPREQAEPLSPEDEAALILQRARDEAEALIAEARREGERIRTAAYEEGRQAADEELNAAIARLDQYKVELEAQVTSQVEEFWTSVEPELLKLAVDIARKIVRREVAENREFIFDAVRAGLHQLAERQNLKIRVNPSDYQFVREHRADLVAGFETEQMDVIEDRRVDEGGWAIESPNGHLDGRIETQLREVEKSLLETCHNGGNQIAA